MITIKEMADKLGISATTISNVIHGKTSEVSPATIELVERTIKECGYVPNINARNLAKNQSHIIGVVMKERKGQHENLISNSFYGELLGAAEKKIRSKGYYTMMYISDSMDEIVKYVTTWNVDGLIMVSMDYRDVKRLRKMYDRPLVLIDCYNCTDGADEVNITLDDARGAFELTEYLIQCGHKNIAYLAYRTEGIAEIRYKGCIRAMEQYGLSWEPEHFPVIDICRLGREIAFKTVYDLRKQCTAVICSSDYYAAKLICYLEDKGVKVPEDISIGGFDNDDFAKIVRPRLTTVGQDVSEKGRKAVEYLTDIIEGKQVQKRDMHLPFELIVRDSVKKLV